jgi:hypothetical protein
MHLMERALQREVLFKFNVANEVSRNVVDHWSVYVVFLWRVCLFYGDVADEEEEKKVLGQLVLVLHVTDCGHIDL